MPRCDVFRGFSSRNELLITVEVAREAGLMRNVIVREPQQVGILKSGKTNLRWKIKGVFLNLSFIALLLGCSHYQRLEFVLK